MLEHGKQKAQRMLGIKTPEKPLSPSKKMTHCGFNELKTAVVGWKINLTKLIAALTECAKMNKKKMLKLEK